MTDDEAIQHLIVTPPAVVLSRRDRIWQNVGRVCSVIAVISLAVGVFALIKFATLASCTNDNLGQRSRPQALDNAATLAFYKSLEVLFAAPPDQQKTLGLAAVAQIGKTYNALVADQAMRDAHPLGKC